ncbi:MAG: sodium:proton antiporter [Desulfurococcaceae archaeon]|nr:sodium:proton antiporter [Desulfurococcaceae archaeon]
MIDVFTFLFTICMLSIVVNLGISLYGVLYKPSLIKKIISLTIFSDSANITAIIIGYVRWRNPGEIAPPVLLNPNPTLEDIEEFAKVAVDPLPQALVLTAIVIGLAVTLFLVFLTLQIYRFYGTTDVRRIAKLKG